MKILPALLSLMLLVSGGATLNSCKAGSDGHKHAATTRFHCPMHPTYTSDKPGDCPICGMRLVPISMEADENVSPAAPEAKPLHYRHPMNPEIISPEPKKDEMGMDYVPVYHDEKAANARALPDRAPVSLSAERRQLIGVRTVPATRKRLENLIRASGRVAYDPELYNAITEYRQALQAKEKVQESPWPDVKERADALVGSSVLRLRQMGLSQDQIRSMGAAPGDPTNLLLAEAGGTVWVYAQIYEFEAGQIKRGQMMEVASPALPGRAFSGKVVAVDAILNPETRTLRVRGEVPNRDGLLKPEMYVDVTLHVDLGEKLAIPEEAVVRTGTRQIVFVETGAGLFEPREVTLGAKAENHYEIVAGVKEGERVVSSANFLIDSESRLKAALSGSGAGGGDGHAH